MPANRCTCHERDSSQTCDQCKSEGYYGHCEQPPKLFYQLCALGRYQMGEGRGKIVSKIIYPDEDTALAHCASFKEKCCGSGLSDLDPGSTKIHVTALELYDGEFELEDDVSSESSAQPS